MICPRRQSLITSSSGYFLLLVIPLCASAQQYAGESCSVAGTSYSEGVCKSARQCPQAFSGFIRPNICSYVGNDAIICCPKSSQHNAGGGGGGVSAFQPGSDSSFNQGGGGGVSAFPQGSNNTPRPQGGLNIPQTSRPVNTEQGNRGGGSRPSLIKCEEYAKLAVKKFSVAPLILDPEVFDFEVPNCDFSVPLIVDGEKTKPGEFPHMAAIGWRNEQGGIDYNCGGVLISDGFVVTAAHCASFDGKAPVTVRLGEQNLKQDNDNADPKDYRISEVIEHPQYRRPKNYNDIALLRLAPKVSFNKFIRPACLWQQNNINVTKVVASGWGLTDFASEKSDELLKALLHIYPLDECRPFYADDAKTRKLPNGIIDSQLCAGNRGAGRQDTCQGDSGGPLQIVNAGSCTFHIVGITSFGKSCGLESTPGVYTRVSSYLDWIEQHVWPEL